MAAVNQNVSTRATCAHDLNQHQTSHKPKGKAASPTLNRLANHKATDSAALPKGAEQ